jgi:tetratricopeptide (TPR) repeat protein
LDRALRLAKELGDVVSEAVVEENRSALFLATGRLGEAEASAMNAYGIAEQRHDNTRRAASLRHLARVGRVRDGSSPQALSVLERALALCELGEDAELRAEVLLDLGDAYRDAADSSRAKECWRRALELARIAGFTAMIGGIQMRLRPGASDRAAPGPEAAAS